MVFSYEEVRGYWNELLDTMRGVRQDAAEHVKRVKESIKESSRICPVCKSELVKREGKYGEFMGCSSFPKCRYVYK